MACTRGRRQPFSCGHRGYGKICHRCKQADLILEKAGNDSKDVQAQDMRKEATRLKLVPRKSNGVVVSSVLPTT